MNKNEHRNDSWKQEQHEAVRNTVGFYRFTHHLLDVSGEDAPAFLDQMFVSNIAGGKVGGAKYTTMLNEDGIIIDDIVVFRLEETKFWISTLFGFKLIEWFDDHKAGFDVSYGDLLEEEMYAVQGPRSLELVNAVAAEPVDDLKFFNIRDNEVNGISVKISRCGYSGERGYEIYVDRAHMEDIHMALVEAGKAFGAKEVTELQVMVHTLATEKGFNLMTDLRGLNPLEADPNAKIDWDKAFIGKKALMKARDAGITRQLVGFEFDDPDAFCESRHRGGNGAPVLLNGEEVSRVTKNTYGFTLEKNIGFAIIDTTRAKIGDRVKINRFDATLTEKTWYDPQSNRPFGR